MKNFENYVIIAALGLLILIGITYKNKRFRKTNLPPTPITHNPDLNDKVSLLGIVTNQNNAVIANQRPAEELMFINPDWTVDKMPSQVAVEPTTEIFLKKHLRKRR